jgi:hypothetical protein
MSEPVPAESPVPATEPRTGPKPMRYDPERHAEAMAALAAKPEPEPGAGGSETGTQIDAEPSDGDTVHEGKTQRVFADAFGPGDDGGLAPEDYDALVAEYEDSADEEPDDTDDGVEEAEPASRREARYRTRLRDTEARLEAATDENISLLNRLEAMQWTEAIRLASTRLADPAADLFREHYVDAVLADDGTVDPQRVNELVDTILRDHPHYGVQKPAVNPNGLKSGASKPADPPSASSWQRAFAPPPRSRIGPIAVEAPTI